MSLNSLLEITKKKRTHYANKRSSSIYYIEMYSSIIKIKLEPMLIRVIF